jgi:hypothetical protein
MRPFHQLKLQSLFYRYAARPKYFGFSCFQGQTSLIKKIFWAYCNTRHLRGRLARARERKDLRSHFEEKCGKPNRNGANLWSWMQFKIVHWLDLILLFFLNLFTVSVILQKYGANDKINCRLNDRSNHYVFFLCGRKNLPRKSWVGVKFEIGLPCG